VRGAARCLGAVALAGAAGLAAPSIVGAGTMQETQPHHVATRGLIAKWTKSHGELRKTIPIANRPGRRTRSVLSVALPRVKRGDRIRFNGEVALSTTCVTPSPHCIGRRYRFDPHLRAQIVIGKRRRAAGRRTRAISRAVKLTCGQSRPTRNHHCPLVIGRGSVVIDRRRSLPCPPSRCRMNMVVDAHHRRARGGEVVVVGWDLLDGSIDQGKARLNAAVSRHGTEIVTRTRSTKHRRVRRLPTPSHKDPRVVYSRRLKGLQAGDVLLIRARQRTHIKRLPYYIGSKVVVSTGPRARRSRPLTRRIVSRSGTATEVNGFNCTLGPSAFRNPCLTRKAGLALIKRTPRRQGGGSRPLFVNLVSWGFPKPEQERLASYPPLRVIRGGGLTVRWLRVRSGRGPGSG
jgi:hypothetical protein